MPSVVYSIAKCYVRPDGKSYEPYAVYAGDELVGFYTLSYETDDPTKCYFGGFLIDRAHQGRGYGRAAVLAFVERTKRERPLCEEIYLAVHPSNRVAERLYASLGFEKFGFVVDGEAGMRLRIR